MLTAEFKVNGARVGAVTIRNVAGAAGPRLEGIADYEVQLLTPTHYNLGLEVSATAQVLDWDRSRPAHELVHAAIEAIMRAKP